MSFTLHIQLFIPYILTKSSKICSIDTIFIDRNWQTKYSLLSNIFHYLIKTQLSINNEIFAGAECGGEKNFAMGAAENLYESRNWGRDMLMGVPERRGPSWPPMNESAGATLVPFAQPRNFRGV